LYLPNRNKFIFTAKGFIQCQISDNKFDECLRDAIGMALPHLADGKKE